MTQDRLNWLDVALIVFGPFAVGIAVLMYIENMPSHGDEGAPCFENRTCKRPFRCLSWAVSSLDNGSICIRPDDDHLFLDGKGFFPVPRGAQQ